MEPRTNCTKLYWLFPLVHNFVPCNCDKQHWRHEFGSERTFFKNFFWCCRRTIGDHEQQAWAKIATYMKIRGRQVFFTSTPKRSKANHCISGPSLSYFRFIPFFFIFKESNSRKTTFDEKLNQYRPPTSHNLFYSKQRLISHIGSIWNAFDMLFDMGSLAMVFFWRMISTRRWRLTHGCCKRGFLPSISKFCITRSRSLLTNATPWSEAFCYHFHVAKFHLHSLVTNIFASIWLCFSFRYFNITIGY